MGDAGISLPHKDKQNWTNTEAGKIRSVEEGVEPDSLVGWEGKRANPCFVLCANLLSIFDSQGQVQEK